MPASKVRDGVVWDAILMDWKPDILSARFWRYQPSSISLNEKGSTGSSKRRVMLAPKSKPIKEGEVKSATTVAGSDVFFDPFTTASVLPYMSVRPPPCSYLKGWWLRKAWCGPHNFS